jgi:TonB family protein
MDLHTGVRWMLLAALLTASGGEAPAQSPAAKFQESLVGQPLYLKGFWQNDQLEFDGEGKPVGKAQAGPFTRSGIDVRKVSLEGKNLVIRGNRVALVANADGRLERHLLGSSTSINPLFHRKRPKIYVAEEKVTLLVHPDAAGGFEASLKAIFANGLEDLAAYVPSYWGCYAEGYFIPGKAGEDAGEAVEGCVRRRSLASADRYAGEGTLTPPQIVGDVSPQVGPLDASLKVGGTVRIHMTVTRAGVPVGFQIVQAVGAGIDEQILRTVYEMHFKPAMRGQTPIPADFEFNLQLSAHD